MDDKFLTMVKIGPRGQIVVPKKVREMFDLHPSDSLIFMADRNRGMCLIRADIAEKIADQIFSGSYRNEMNDIIGEKQRFAGKLKEITKNERDRNKRTD